METLVQYLLDKASSAGCCSAWESVWGRAVLCCGGVFATRRLIAVPRERPRMVFSSAGLALPSNQQCTRSRGPR